MSSARFPAAGCWTVGIAASGNSVGLSLADYNDLAEADRRARVAVASQVLADAGAHYVIDTVADLPGVFDAIEARLAAGQLPG